jgi:hypothetical protein
MSVIGLAASLVVHAARDVDLHPMSPDSILNDKLDAVGMVLSGHGEKLSIATGFMVSSCHVLTAAHVVSESGKRVAMDAEVRFVSGMKGSRPVTGRVVAASKNFVRRDAPTGFDPTRISSDWALVELDTPITSVTPIKLLFPEAEVSPGVTYSVAGFPYGLFQQGIVVQEGCRNWSEFHGGKKLAGVLIADCAVRLGMSGGPLLLDDSDQPIAAGIIVERFSIADKVMTIAAPISSFAEKLTDTMRDSDICAVGAPFVLPSKPAGGSR